MRWTLRTKVFSSASLFAFEAEMKGLGHSRKNCVPTDSFGFPPIPQKKAERVGHGELQQKGKRIMRESSAKAATQRGNAPKGIGGART
jgi:hypothetical protein